MQGDSQPVLLTKVRPIAEALKLDKSKEGSTEAWGLQPGRYVASIPLHARLSPAGKNEVVGLLLVYSEVRVAKLVAVEFLAKLCSLGIEYSLLRTPNVLPSERYQDALPDFNRMKERVRRLKANPADIQKRQWDEAYQQWLQDLVGSLERHVTDSADLDAVRDLHRLGADVVLSEFLTHLSATFSNAGSFIRDVHILMGLGIKPFEQFAKAQKRHRSYDALLLTDEFLVAIDQEMAFNDLLQLFDRASQSILPHDACFVWAFTADERRCCLASDARFDPNGSEVLAGRLTASSGEAFDSIDALRLAKGLSDPFPIGAVSRR